MSTDQILALMEVAPTLESPTTFPLSGRTVDEASGVAMGTLHANETRVGTASRWR